jgi:hypothetical protein
MTMSVSDRTGPADGNAGHQLVSRLYMDFMRLDDGDQAPQCFTVLRDTGHDNLSQVFRETS